MYEFNRLVRNGDDPECDSIDEVYIALTAILDFYEYQEQMIPYEKCLWLWYNRNDTNLYTIKQFLHNSESKCDNIVATKSGLYVNLFDIDDTEVDRRYAIISKWWNSIAKEDRKDVIKRYIVDSMI